MHGVLSSPFPQPVFLNQLLFLLLMRLFSFSEGISAGGGAGGTRAESALDARAARVRRRHLDAHARERSVAARRHGLRGVHARVSAARAAAAHARASGHSGVAWRRCSRARSSGARTIASTPSPQCCASSIARWGATRRCSRAARWPRHARARRERGGAPALGHRRGLRSDGAGSDRAPSARCGACAISRSSARWRSRCCTRKSSSDENAVHRFRREAQLAAQLAHPSIVPIYDWDSSGGVAWYTMELAEGGSLADLVARSGPRTIAEIAPQIDQVLDGLAAAHASGIIHRDLKPENILIDRYRRWRIADFGVAKIPGEEISGTTGTPEFAAPEQLLGEAAGHAGGLLRDRGDHVLPARRQAALRHWRRTRDSRARALGRRRPLGDRARCGRVVEAGARGAPENRFADATAMRECVARSRRGRRSNAEEHAPWWRRLFTSEMNVNDGS